MSLNFTSGSVSIAFCTLLEDYKEEKKNINCHFQRKARSKFALYNDADLQHC